MEIVCQFNAMIQRAREMSNVHLIKFVKMAIVSSRVDWNVAELMQFARLKDLTKQCANVLRVMSETHITNVVTNNSINHRKRNVMSMTIVDMRNHVETTSALIRAQLMATHVDEMLTATSNITSQFADVQKITTEIHK
jgi:hypothetical protein